MSPNSSKKQAENPSTEGMGMDRRQFLILSALAAGGGLATVLFFDPAKTLVLASKATGQLLTSPMPSPLLSPLDSHVQVDPISPLDPSAIPKFENQLTGPPPVYKPAVFTSGGKVVRHDHTVAMNSFSQQILPQSMNLTTPVWGYSGEAADAVTGADLGTVQSSPGPTFEAIRGIPIQVAWQNNITSAYALPVDPSIHWANPTNAPMPSMPYKTYPPGYTEAQSPVPLVTHLHGGENQSPSDGGPTQWFTADGKHGQTYYTKENSGPNAAVYYYPNTQQPTTLWYHDHALGLTRLNVLSGLAGFYLLRAPNDGSDKVASMLPSGKYEMPIVIQDRSFNSDGSLSYPTVGDAPDLHPYWVKMFSGNTIMVNGKVWPNMNVDRGQYRLRFLNGSNSRIYNLAFSNGMTFVQIGSDGGYLQNTVELTSFNLGPAERADIVVNFSGLAAGQAVVLQNTLGETADLMQVMQFTANSSTGTTPFDVHAIQPPLNPTLPGATFPTLPKPSKTRTLTLYEVAQASGAISQALLDGQAWDASVSETPQLGATEEWVLVNPSMDQHPIHLHLVQFQLVSRQKIAASSTYINDWIALNGAPPFNHATKNVSNLQSYLFTNPSGPMPQEQGWKDTIVVNGGEVVTIRVRFAQQDGSAFPFDATSGQGYVWHCHILEHEDNEMMRPYKLSAAQISLDVPIAVAVVGGAAAAAWLAYYYRKRRAHPSAEAAGFAKSSEVGNVQPLDAAGGSG